MLPDCDVYGVASVISDEQLVVLRLLKPCNDVVDGIDISGEAQSIYSEVGVWTVPTDTSDLIGRHADLRISKRFGAAKLNSL
jgi:hypothetical protein